MTFEPLVRREGTARWIAKNIGKDARLEKRKRAIEFEEVTDIKRNAEKKGKIRLNKQRFGAFKMLWDGYTNETSDALFDELHIEQSGCWDTNGEKIVRIDNVGSEDVTETGKESRRGVKRENGLSNNEFMAKKIVIIGAAHVPISPSLPSPLSRRSEER